MNGKQSVNIELVAPTSRGSHVRSVRPERFGCSGNQHKEGDNWVAWACHSAGMCAQGSQPVAFRRDARWSEAPEVEERDGVTAYKAPGIDPKDVDGIIEFVNLPPA